MTREELQQGAARILYDVKRLICQWCTGCGKTGVAIDFLKAHPSPRTLVCVPETDNIKNWREEFRKFNFDSSSVDIACYASLHKYVNTDWDLIVFDEVPHTNTGLKKEYLSTITATHILALGAVLSYDEISALFELYGQFHINTVTLEQAIQWGILPEPEIYVVHLQMNNTNKNHWWNGKKLTDKELYDSVSEQITNLNKALDSGEATPSMYSRMLRLGAMRKRHLGLCKEEAIRRICNGLDSKNRRYLCFCSSIDQTKRLCREHSYTSKTEAGQNLLEKFNNHEIDSLFVVAKLIEGQNLYDIECGVIGQIGGKERITVQQAGRIMRSKKPRIYIPIFDGTKDDSFLYTVTSNIPEKYIKHYKF